MAALWRSAVCSMFIMAVMFVPEIGSNLLLTLIYIIALGVIIYLLTSYVLNRSMMKSLLAKIIRKSHERR